MNKQFDLYHGPKNRGNLLNLFGAPKVYGTVPPTRHWGFGPFRRRVNTETATWAFQGAKVGMAIGVTLGAVVSVVLMMGAGNSFGADPEFEMRSVMIFLAAPIIGLVFGGFAGTLVGVGTPKFNPDPQQGRTEPK